MGPHPDTVHPHLDMVNNGQPKNTPQPIFENRAAEGTSDDGVPSAY
jgi:hypothetical protein